jgi:phage gp36-like protein
MEYSEVDNLLIGDLILSSAINKQAFVQDASDEIDSRIGPRYLTPLNLNALADHSAKLVRRIANNLASGRLIMAVTSAGEDLAVHNYGLYLCKEAASALAAIANGQVDLVGATPQDVFGTSGSTPAIQNEDADSAVDAFYRHVMRQENIGWTPGQ